MDSEVRRRKKRIYLMIVLILVTSFIFAAVTMSNNFDQGFVLGEGVGDEFAYSTWRCANGSEVFSRDNTCRSLQNISQLAISNCGECISWDMCDLEAMYVAYMCVDGESPCVQISDEGECLDQVAAPTVTPIPTEAVHACCEGADYNNDGSITQEDLAIFGSRCYNASFPKDGCVDHVDDGIYNIQDLSCLGGQCVQ